MNEFTEITQSMGFNFKSGDFVKVGKAKGATLWEVLGLKKTLPDFKGDIEIVVRSSKKVVENINIFKIREVIKTK